jgi:hypothetical protein
MDAQQRKLEENLLRAQMHVIIGTLAGALALIEAMQNCADKTPEERERIAFLIGNQLAVTRAKWARDLQKMKEMAHG